MNATTPPTLRQVALPAFGPTISSGIGFGAMAAVLALQARALGASVGQAAALVALIGVGQFVMSLPAGALVARIGERRALTITGLLEAALMVGAWRTTSLPLLAVLVFLSGMAWTVFLLARQGFIIDAFPVSQRARALSTLGGSHRIGALIGPLIGAVLIHQWGLASVFLLAAVTSVLSVVIVQTMPDLNERHRTQGPPLKVLEVIREHRRVLLRLGSAVAIIGASRSLRMVLIPLWCEHVGLEPAATSLIIGIAAAVDVSLFYPAGWVMDHRGRAPVAAVVVGTTALGCLLLPLATGFAGVLAVTVLIAVGNGMGSGIVMTMGADTAPAQGRAQYLGAWRLFGDAGNLAGPFALSALTVALPLAGACLVLGGVGVVGTAWVRQCARRLDLRRAETPRAPTGD